jgi:glyceraldehyde 3-phosphate dehydrogenase
MRVGINGMGRIGRLALRASLGAIDRPHDDPRAGNRLDLVHVNEVRGGAAVTAHLLEFDSLHGRWHQKFGAEDDQAIIIGNRRIGFSAASLPGEVAWGDLGCDIVLECTGKFLKPDQFQGYFDRGVHRVIVAAPVKDPAALSDRPASGWRRTLARDCTVLHRNSHSRMRVPARPRPTPKHLALF